MEKNVNVFTIECSMAKVDPPHASSYPESMEEDLYFVFKKSEINKPQILTTVSGTIK
jgi:hypothetical protein